jgi:hypothetical protein
MSREIVHLSYMDTHQELKIQCSFSDIKKNNKYKKLSDDCKFSKIVKFHTARNIFY